MGPLVRNGFECGIVGPSRFCDLAVITFDDHWQKSWSKLQEAGSFTLRNRAAAVNGCFDGTFSCTLVHPILIARKEHGYECFCTLLVPMMICLDSSKETNLWQPFENWAKGRQTSSSSRRRVTSTHAAMACTRSLMIWPAREVPGHRS